LSIEENANAIRALRAAFVSLGAKMLDVVFFVSI
jgi:hypothetical protein